MAERQVDKAAYGSMEEAVVGIFDGDSYDVVGAVPTGRENTFWVVSVNHWGDVVVYEVSVDDRGDVYHVFVKVVDVESVRGENSEVAGILGRLGL